jgi:hypothetical protein
MSVLRTFAVAATAVVVSLPLAGATAAQTGSTARSSDAQHVATAKRHVTYVALTGGRTRLTLDAGTAAALTSNHVTVAPVSEARAGKAGITFPIQGGLLNAATLAGSINHSGGLVFKAGGKSLTIRDFKVSARTRTLTAWVDQVGARIPVLRLNLSKATVRSTKSRLRIGQVRTTLRKGAAQALNDYFSTSLFSGGLPIGTVRVSASIKVLKG